MFLPHYCCNQNNFKTLLGFLWLSRLGFILHHVLMTRSIQIRLQTVSPFDLSVSFHSVLAHNPLIKHCLCWEQPVPGHRLFSTLAAVHWVTVAEEYIIAFSFLLTMPAVCLPFYRDEPEGRPQWSRVSQELRRVDIKYLHSFKSECTKSLLTSWCSLIVV